MLRHNLYRNMYKLKGDLAFKGYDSWFHFFSGASAKTGEIKNFSVEYTIINPQLGREYPEEGDLEEGIRPSYFKVAVTSFGKNPARAERLIAISDMNISENMLKISAEDCFISENNIWGRIGYGLKIYEEDDHKADWSLKINKTVPYGTGNKAGLYARSLDIHDNYWHAEGLMTLYSGYMIFDDEEYVVIPGTSNGYADKVWGSKMPATVVQLSSSDCTSQLTGRKLLDTAIAARGLDGRGKLSLCIYHKGKVYEFIKENKSLLTIGKFRWHETRDKIYWRAKLLNKKYAAEIIIACPKKKMVCYEVASPSGEKNHNKFMQGGDAIGHVTLLERSMKEYKMIDKFNIKNGSCMISET